MLKTLFRKLYWLTLRQHGKLGHFLTKGMRATIVTTTRCPLKCSYCPMYLYGDVRPYPESSFQEWKEFIEKFPYWLSQIYVSGGEPSLYKDIVPLINWLIERGHHVIVFTNLWRINNFVGIKPHWRLIFQPTYHKGDNLGRFTRALKIMKLDFQVTSQQVSENPNGLSRIKEFFNRDWFENTDDGFQFPPDAPRSARVFIGCKELYRK